MAADEQLLAERPLTLGEYIRDLLDVAGAAHPEALLRMRQVVEGRAARIVLDDESVDIWFDATGLQVQSEPVESEVAGLGATDSATVLAILDGHLEVSSAILNDQLRIFGAPDDVSRMFIAIEILLDTAPRTPALQALAARFRRERGNPTSLARPENQPAPWYPFGIRTSEYELLSRLGLLLGI